MMRAVVPHMVRQGNGGRIVNIAGIAARQSFGGGETAGGVNAAVVNLTKGVAEQFQRHRILVNAIHPGATRTERHQMNLQSKSAAEGISLEEAERATVADIPLGRMIEPEEVAYLAVFLCSNQANATTGGAMAVDGGQTRAVSY
jgi:NAD(P)-dependent dehydrogenase (short-subunit alcohol dehydrogenase family)